MGEACTGAGGGKSAERRALVICTVMIAECQLSQVAAADPLDGGASCDPVARFCERASPSGRGLGMRERGKECDARIASYSNKTFIAILDLNTALLNLKSNSLFF